ESASRSVSSKLPSRTPSSTCGGNTPRCSAEARATQPSRDGKTGSVSNPTRRRETASDRARYVPLVPRDRRRVDSMTRYWPAGPLAETTHAPSSKDRVHDDPHEVWGILPPSPHPASVRIVTAGLLRSLPDELGHRS